MGGKKELRQAQKLIRKRKYTAVIRILEPQVFRFRQDQSYYFLLGTAYLHTGDISGAATYLKRVVQLNPDNTHAILALAAVHLKQGDNQEAIELWLRILNNDKDNKYAKRGLALLKKSSENPELLEKTVNSHRFYSLVPSHGTYIPPYVPVILVLVFLVPLFLYYFPQIKELFPSRGGRNPDVSKIEIDTQKPVISLEGNYHFVLTEAQIQESMDKAKKYFDDFNDNMAQMEVNRIKYSNAAESIKEKARFIENFFKTPDFSTFTNRFSYEEIEKNPLLYENCYIRWKGKTSNVKITAEAIRFDFLVGYQENKVLEGIVPVVFDFAVSIEQGAPVEVLGKIALKDRNSGKFYIKGTAIRPLAPVSR